MFASELLKNLEPLLGSQCLVEVAGHGVINDLVKVESTSDVFFYFTCGEGIPVEDIYIHLSKLLKRGDYEIYGRVDGLDYPIADFEIGTR